MLKIVFTVPMQRSHSLRCLSLSLSLTLSQSLYLCALSICSLLTPPPPSLSLKGQALCSLDAEESFGPGLPDRRRAIAGPPEGSALMII